MSANEFELSQALIELFEKNQSREFNEIPVFWERLGGTEFIEGKKVLDFGSGLGSMTIDLIKKGASEVHGIEIDDNYKKFAERNLELKYGDYKEKIRYFSESLDSLEDESYDVIVSKDVFEHVIGLDELYPILIKKLKIGGRLLLGFGPLWYSAFGDHGISQRISGFKIPWLHLLMSDQRIFEYLNSKKDADERVSSFEEAGFNRLVPDDYFKILSNAQNLNYQFQKINPSRSTLAKISNIFLKVFNFKIIRKYFVRTVYTVAIKK